MHLEQDGILSPLFLFLCIVHFCEKGDLILKNKYMKGLRLG